MMISVGELDRFSREHNLAVKVRHIEGSVIFCIGLEKRCYDEKC